MKYGYFDDAQREYVISNTGRFCYIKESCQDARNPGDWNSNTAPLTDQSYCKVEVTL